MITLTHPAAEAIRHLATRLALPPAAGLRICPQGYAGSLALSICAQPQADDEIVETEGIRVFLQKEAAAMLDGRVLDARMEDDDLVIRIGARIISR